MTEPAQDRHAAYPPSEWPAIVGRAAWNAAIDELRVREKAHTRAGDALAAERRRLPMVEVDAATRLTGPNGPVTLLDAFEGLRQLVAYFHMWHDGEPFENQCPGCTFYNGQVRELAYLHALDITYAVLCHGPYAESVRYRDFMGWEVPWYSIRGSEDALDAGRWGFMLACYHREGDRVFETYWTAGRGVEIMSPTYGLADRTLFGRQESWEDSPSGWPQGPVQLSTGGRPTAQWSRVTGDDH